MSEISKQALKVDNSTSFPNNTTGYISPTILRGFNVNMIDSLVEQAGYTANSASWNVSISNLNTYTASFAPSLTQLNAFTASQLTINTGVNGFTQSANSSITQLNTQTASFYQYTASINQIQSNGVVLGTSTRFNLVGSTTFFSASLTPNVGGQIATLTFTSDDSKVNTSSFNDYTASTAATQSVFSASVATSFSSSNATFTQFSASQNNFNLSATASIVELLNLSSSLSGGYATQGELDQSASVLQANINQKLFTSSFNDYTQSTSNTIATLTTTASFNSYTASTNPRLNSLEIRTGSYAVTGSNTFIGNQIITGSFIITGSTYGNVVSTSISTQTASIDLSSANYFTLTLSGSTNINVLNPKPGNTAILRITTSATSSVTFSSNVLQPTGSIYSPTAGANNIDILTLTAFDTGSVYVISATQFK